MPIPTYFAFQVREKLF
ncbi:hypothetical protein Gogos_015729 [Gossypium gossypioides]|uniref:Uncharacterized protein n=1 Tax=Gossypium gossypioides TaxID=34282 RepID=A0A7J9C2R3_GOSGO|nr:hypothetical protein [Gossypium gossypioides]